jgi:hypothetical protein
MKMNKIYYVVLILITGIISAGCVEKFDLTEFNLSGTGANISGDTVYVQINPVWEGFNHPQDIIIGKEPFIYIADTDNNRIVMMNLDGQVLGTKAIKKPVALTQDYKLNLFVVADFDTLVGGSTITYSAVYKIDLFNASHNLEQAQVTRLIPRTLKDFSKRERIYTGVAAFFDNSIIVSSKGPVNTIIGEPPDNSIWRLHFKKTAAGKDTIIVDRVPNIDPLSSGLVSANQVSSLASFTRKTIDFVATLTGNNSFKVQWFTYVVTAQGEDYKSKFSPSDGVDLAMPNKFDQPEGSTIDFAGNIYIVDAMKDSIFKFNSFGDELQSFGGPEIFKSPYAVAFFDKTLYVADTGNNRILRFILSTDLR